MRVADLIDRPRGLCAERRVPGGVCKRLQRRLRDGPDAPERPRGTDADVQRLVLECFGQFGHGGGSGRADASQPLTGRPPDARHGVVKRCRQRAGRRGGAGADRSQCFRRVQSDVRIGVRERFDQRGDGGGGLPAQRAQRASRIPCDHSILVFQRPAQHQLDRFGIGGHVDEKINRLAAIGDAIILEYFGEHPDCRRADPVGDLETGLAEVRVVVM